MAEAEGRLVILDRDGVINVLTDDSITDPDAWEALPGSMDAIALLVQSGYTVAVAENMSGIGLGKISMKELNEVHAKMCTHIQKAGGQIAGIWFCPHKADEKCSCRKPRPGMLEDIIDRVHHKGGKAWMVGDSIRDVQAAENAGCVPVLVLTGKGKDTLASCNLPEDTRIFDDLAAFARHLAENDAINSEKEE